MAQVRAERGEHGRIDSGPYMVLSRVLWFCGFCFRRLPSIFFPCHEQVDSCSLVPKTATGSNDVKWFWRETGRLQFESARSGLICSNWTLCQFDYLLKFFFILATYIHTYYLHTYIHTCIHTYIREAGYDQNLSFGLIRVVAQHGAAPPAIM